MKITKNMFLIAAAFSFLALPGCKKDSGGGTPSMSVDSETQASFKVNGTTVNLKAGENDVSAYNFNDGEIAGWPDTSESIYGYGFDKNAQTEPVLEIAKGTIKYVGATDSAGFCAFFIKKSYPYSVDAVNGIEIAYFDDAGTRWSTSLGTANQAGSSFAITENKFHTFSGWKYMKVKATFTCKVYDGNGASKSITDGVSILDFWADY